MNFLDLFAQRLREKREQKKITQRELAERLNMCTRTVIEIEKCKSNPKFETVALISEEMDISLDGIVFHDRAPQTVAKCVVDYFAGKSEAESQKYPVRPLKWHASWVQNVVRQFGLYLSWAQEI